MNQTLESLVQEIFHLTAEYNQLLGIKQKQILHPPATDAEKDALEAHLGVKLPLSYRDLLSICNGWVGYSADVDLLSVEQQLQGEYARYIHQWKDEQRAIDESVPVKGIVFAIALHTNHAHIFDTDTADKAGELEAVWWDDGELHRYANLTEMLEQQRERLKRLISRKHR